MKNSVAYNQIGYLFFQTGLAEIFGIEPTDDLFKNPDNKTALIFGFLKAAAEGNLEDPQNIEKWQRLGEELLY